MTELEKLKILTNESDETLLSLLLEDAEAQVLGYTNRTKLIDELRKPTRDLALIAYNRLGTEGETGRSEAGESYSFNDAPTQVYSVLNKHRLARCGGHAHEEIEGADVPIEEQERDEGP